MMRMNINKMKANLLEVMLDLDNPSRELVDKFWDLIFDVEKHVHKQEEILKYIQGKLK